MKRHRALLRFALGSLARRAGRNGAIGVALLFVSSMIMSVLFIADSLRHEVELGIDVAPDLTLQRLVGGRPATIPAATAANIEALPGVRAVYPRVWGYVFLEALGGNMTVVGRHHGTSLPHALVDDVARRANQPAEPPQAQVGSALARLLGVRPGDRMVLPRFDGEMMLIEATDIFEAPSALHTADLLVVTPHVARDLLGVPANEATDIAVELTTPDEASVVAARLANTIPGARVLDRRSLKRTYELTFDGRAGLITALMLPAIAALLLLVWQRLSGIGTTERAEIGVLKSVGWSTADVLAVRAWESLIVSFFASGGAFVLAYLFVFAAGAPGLRGALLGWSTIYPAFNLTPQVDIAQAASLLGLVIVPFVAVSVVPAWRAATLDPTQAMRGLR